MANNTFDILIDSIELDAEEFVKKYGPSQVGKHGRLTDVKQMAYGDLYIYEDGYEEYISIGD